MGTENAPLAPPPVMTKGVPAPPVMAPPQIKRDGSVPAPPTAPPVPQAQAPQPAASRGTAPAFLADIAKGKGSSGLKKVSPPAEKQLGVGRVVNGQPAGQQSIQREEPAAGRGPVAPGLLAELANGQAMLKKRRAPAAPVTEAKVEETPVVREQSGGDLMAELRKALSGNLRKTAPSDDSTKDSTTKKQRKEEEEIKNVVVEEEPVKKQKEK